MRLVCRRLGLLFALAIFLGTLPGSGAELRICLSADGQVEVSTTTEHSCRGASRSAAPCHGVSSQPHERCMDVVLCGVDANCRHSLSHLASLPPARSAPSSLAPFALWTVAPPPVVVAARADLRAPALMQHLGTVVLRL